MALRVQAKTSCCQLLDHGAESVVFDGVLRVQALAKATSPSELEAAQGTPPVPYRTKN